MKIFLTKKKLDEYLQDKVAKDRYAFMQATARNAAKEAVHYYICWRTIDWWRKALDEAEAEADSKYIRLADLLTRIEKENSH